MATLLVHHKVQDYEVWRKIFDDDAKRRKEYGSTGFQVLKSTSNPNDLTVLMEWPSVEAAKAFATSESLKEKMQNAGVISKPEMIFLIEV